MKSNRVAGLVYRKGKLVLEFENLLGLPPQKWIDGNKERAKNATGFILVMCEEKTSGCDEYNFMVAGMDTEQVMRGMRSFLEFSMFDELT